MTIDIRLFISGLTKFLFLFFLVASSYLMARSSLITSHPHLSSAITIDLLITFPVAYYFFIRRTWIPNRTVIPAFIYAVILASFILPANDRALLDLAITYLVPLVEIAALVYFGFIVYKARLTYKKLAEKGGDFQENLREIFLVQLGLPALARSAAFEFGAIYFALFRWRQQNTEGRYTYHKKSGIIALLVVLVGMLVVETVIVHYLVGLWSHIAAWILTAISVYFIAQLFAHLKAVVHRPVELHEDILRVRCGMMGDAETEIENIKSIQVIAPADVSKDGVVLTELGDMSPPNIKLELFNDRMVNSFYWIQRKFTILYFAVDEPEEFAGLINRKIAQ